MDGVLYEADLRNVMRNGQLVQSNLARGQRRVIQFKLFNAYDNSQFTLRRCRSVWRLWPIAFNYF